MSNEHTNETTGARLSDAQVAQIERDLDDVQAYRITSKIKSRRSRQFEAAVVNDFVDEVGALLADRVALVAEVARLEAEAHGWQQVIEEEQRTREIAQERYGNALGVQSALEAENADLKRLLGQDVARAAQWERRAEVAEAQIAAMRPLVEAHANLVDVNIDDELACAACERWLGPGKPHAPDCSKVAARALVATMQPPAAPTPDAEAGK